VGCAPHRTTVEEENLLAGDGERDELSEEGGEPGPAGPDDGIGLQRSVTGQDGGARWPGVGGQQLPLWFLAWQ